MRTQIRNSAPESETSVAEHHPGIWVMDTTLQSVTK